MRKTIRTITGGRKQKRPDLRPGLFSDNRAIAGARQPSIVRADEYEDSSVSGGHGWN
ncbi:hypothetical protein [Salinisphaera japonica]|uniref:hypothetical protein n=1 Tax=Salinisphaera japonica TaxID=1304270 RepID=UPI00161BAA9C|nr:hypothetical protein [Salinisphaera japonica]